MGTGCMIDRGDEGGGGGLVGSESHRMHLLHFRNRKTEARGSPTIFGSQY